MLNLLGRKSEGREELDHNLHQNLRQGWRRRDTGVNTESVNEVLEGCKEVDECVIASVDVFDRLRSLDVTEIFRGNRKVRHTASRMAIPANIAFAGGNG